MTQEIVKSVVSVFSREEHNVNTNLLGAYTTMDGPDNCFWCVLIPSDECVGVILDIFFDSTAKTLVIYREFWYFSRIFPTLFSQLISIFMSLLHTFSKGVKIDARLPRSERFASIMRSGVLSASCGTPRRVRTITNMGVVTF